MKTLLILGATGLVGQQLLEQALATPNVAQVIAPTRRALPPHAKLLNPLVRFDALPTDAPWWRADAAICTLGTTMRQAGSPDAFRQVDHDYVLETARLARHAGTPTFVLNSSVGASASSNSFYLRVKGETEHTLAQLGFDSFTTVRPSILDGGKRLESRPGETIMLWLTRLFAFIIPPRYRAVKTAKLATCLLAAALAAQAGTHIVESEAIGRT